MKKLRKKDVVHKLSTYVRHNITTLAQQGQLAQLSPIFWLALDARRQEICNNFYVLADIARALYTTAFYFDIDANGGGLFAEFDHKKELFVPIGKMRWDAEQDLLYSKAFCFDCVRQLKRLSFIDFAHKRYGLKENQLPLMRSVKEDFTFLYQERYAALISVTELPGPPPYFVELGIGNKRFETMKLYAEQIRFLDEQWDELFDETDWDQLMSVSENIQYNYHAIDEMWRERMGI